MLQQLHDTQAAPACLTALHPVRFLKLALCSQVAVAKTPRLLRLNSKFETLGRLLRAFASAHSLLSKCSLARKALC